MTETAKVRSGLVFCLCFLAGLCEGYDMLVAGITAPKFAPVFGLDPQNLGIVFSASTFGLFVGALAGGRLADYVGRRPVLIVSLVALGVFSIGTTLAIDTNSLLLMRFLTGLGLGGTLPNILAMTNETSSPDRAAMRVTMLGSAMPFGGAIVGILMVAQPDIDWKMVFLIGGLAPLLVAGLMMLMLPESPAFRSHQAAPADAPHSNAPKISVALALGGDRLLPSAMIWISSFFTALSLYMLINWLPSLLGAKGFIKPEAGQIVMFMTFGGAASGFAFGPLTRARRKWPLYIGTWLGMVLSVAGIALTDTNLVAGCAASFGIGFFLSGGQFLLYALSTQLYPAQVRGTGVGFAVGISRLGAVAGPLLAGALLTLHLPVNTVILTVVPLLFIGLSATLPLISTRRNVKTDRVTEA